MNEKTTKVELPEIPGFERYKVGDNTADAGVYFLGSDGYLSECAGGFTVFGHSRIYYHRIKPENPPLPSREKRGATGICMRCRKETMRLVTVGAVCEECAGINRKREPLSFENWQGSLSIKARRKSDNNIVCLTAVPKGLVKEHKTEAIDRITYSEAERDYETLDGKEIGR